MSGGRGDSEARGAPVLLLLSAGLVAMALWSGRLDSRQWSVALLIFAALAVGVTGGILFAGLWRSDARLDDDSDLALLRRLAGPAGALLVFLGCVAFAAVEAHAIGSGLGAGAPGATLSLLGPPLVIGALALRRALGGDVPTRQGGTKDERGTLQEDGTMQKTGRPGSSDRRRPDKGSVTIHE